MKTGGKNSALLTFLLISIIYLLTRWLIFNGFNGTDDMHYAMLAARMMRHQFSPFVSDDIWSGRVLLIGFQAMIYRLGGINVLTTQLGTILATIMSCWLTVFKLLKYDKESQVILATSLFLFNPLLAGATLGILPDSYIMLLFIFIIILIKDIIFKESGTSGFFNPVLLGLILAFSIFIKEITLTFLPCCCVLLLIYKPPKYIKTICILVTAFFFGLLTIGFYYHLHTGNAFFKFVQIRNSDYRYDGSRHYNIKALLIRFTYGLWVRLITDGFYPIMLGSSIVILQWMSAGWKHLKVKFYPISFLVFLTICFFIPFSVHDFSPLIFDSRHFLFLLPLAVVVSSDYIYVMLTDLQNRKAMITIIFILTVLCMINTLNKWQWMIYLLLILFLLSLPILKKHFYNVGWIFCSILWLSLLEPVFFKKHPWFREMQTLNRNLSTRSYYFVDHDDMMNWELLHQFNTSETLYFNLESKPFFIFRHYYSQVDSFTFRPGWFILHKTYTSRSEKFLAHIEALKKTNVFGQIIQLPNMDALLIDKSQTLDTLKKLIATD
jgi:hypothetical protein